MGGLGWVLAGVLLVAALATWAVVRRDRRAAARLAEIEREVDRVRERAVGVSVAEGQLRRALDAIPQGVVIADQRRAVVYRNATAAEFLTARHGDALVEVAIRELVDDAVGGRPSTRTLDLFGPPPRVVEVSAVPLSGPAAGALIVVDDVSERRRLESVRRDFVANISHELKTPVGAIGLLAETLVAEDDIAVTRRLAERMVNEAFRVARTIDDLLDLSRIEAGGTPVREPVPVHLAMAEAMDRIRPAAERRGIALRTEEPSRRLNVLGDRRQLVSALANLLDNAVKYSDPGSEVTLRARTDGRSVELAVEDHGLGIPSRDLERVFERFYRVDRARSRDTGGTGLGLAIVRHVVANLEGEVSVESREGEGSTFTLRLPAGPGPVAVATDRDGTDDTGAGHEAEAG